MTNTTLVNLRRLQVFIAVVQAGSFSRAAARLFLSQPAVSVHVKELETAAGTNLLERGRHQLALTPVGQDLYETALRIVAMVEDLESRIGEQRGSISGNLEIGVTHAWQSLLPRVLADFQLHNQGVFLSVEFGTPDALLLQLLNDRLRIAIMSRRVPDKRFEIRPLSEQKSRLVVLTTSAFRLPDEVEPALLEKFPFIYYPIHQAQELFDYLKIKPNYVMEVSSPGGIIDAVATGLGLSVAAAGLPLPKGVREVPLAIPPLVLPVVAVRRRHRPVSASERALLDYLDSHFPAKGSG